MRILPTLRQLHYLVTLVETRHFGRAAEACHVTQSTLSAGIQELEEVLGVTLLERSKRHVLPTPIGLEVAERARETLKMAGDIVDLAATARAPLSGPLRLGVIPTIGPFLLPPVLTTLRRLHPDLRLYLREDRTARLVEQLQDGALDAVLMALPWPLADLEIMPLGSDGFLAAFSPGHRFAASHAPLDIAALRPPTLPADELLLLEEGHCLRQHALAACDMAGHGSRAFQATSLHTLLQMVSNGLGVTLIPAMALAADALRGLDIVTRPLDGARAAREIGLVWRARSPRGEDFAALGRIIRGHMAGTAPAIDPST